MKKILFCGKIEQAVFRIERWCHLRYISPGFRHYIAIAVVALLALAYFNSSYALYAVGVLASVGSAEMVIGLWRWMGFSPTESTLIAIVLSAVFTSVCFYVASKFPDFNHIGASNGWWYKFVQWWHNFAHKFTKRHHYWAIPFVAILPFSVFAVVIAWRTMKLNFKISFALFMIGNSVKVALAGLGFHGAEWLYKLFT